MGADFAVNALMQPEPSQVSAPRKDPSFHQAVMLELEGICRAPMFASSKRNCEFLTFVVTRTLEGRSAELKERFLGCELFGRPLDYDTGTDAVVRGRANEVRKRLGAHYEKNAPVGSIRILLPLGMYVPSFLNDSPPASGEMASGSSAALPETVPVYREEPDPENFSARTVSLRCLMMPTLIALFLCTLCIRWQLLHGNPFDEFWSSVFAGKSSVTIIIDGDATPDHRIRLSDVKDIQSLLSIAQAFHLTSKVTTAHNNSADDPTNIDIYVTHEIPAGVASSKDLSSTAGGTSIVVTANPLRSVWITSGSDQELETAIEELSDPNRFPEDDAQKMLLAGASSVTLSRKISTLADAGDVSPSFE